MIHESYYWKDDLLKLSRKLESRLLQSRWGERNLYTIEKEIFIGFYSVRKLIESKKISDSIKSKLYDIKEFPHNGNKGSVADPYRIEDYLLTQEKIAKLSVATICNQFIHSFHFIPYFHNGKNLAGFYFCSDHKSATSLYFISLIDIIDIFQIVGKNYPSTMHFFRSQKGKIITEIE
ncbi:hypothetical protein I7V27_16510 [Lelliottia amnigena]|uniref:Uncharacterized protein n=2 Tax=Lelliottia amnigena TaxID=61646 RepID=A0AAP2F0N2_LELAM|nr:hypothetical protein [Lelliottia amnigena]MBL5900529.1 hypothetical protein [Lelliottia amnigena]MBL5936043.1 hypothetical protein [Lelliottia amnigena]